MRGGSTSLWPRKRRTLYLRRLWKCRKLLVTGAVLWFLWAVLLVVRFVAIEPEPRDKFMDYIAVRRWIGLLVYGTPPSFGTASCTISAPCFDLSRCLGHNFTFALYPSSPPSPPSLLDGQPLVTSDYFRAIMAALHRSPYRINDPRRACLLVPSFDHTLVTSALDQPYQIAAYLRTLPLWHGPDGSNGKNFLLFNKHDDAYVEYDPGFAIVAKVGFAYPYFRPEFDISMPPPAAWMAADRNIAPIEGWHLWEENDGLAERKLKYFLTFKGGPTYSPLRNVQLASLLHQPDQGLIYISSYDSSYAYDDLLLNSQFALCPRGNGYYSYRIMEAISAGAIPVILSDRYVLPFHEILDWKSFAVMIPESNVRHTVSILRSLSAQEIKAMRCTLRWVYRTYFFSIQRHVEVALELIKARIYADQHYSPELITQEQSGYNTTVRYKDFVIRQRLDVVPEIASCIAYNSSMQV